MIRLLRLVTAIKESFKFYFTHRICIPSFVLATLYLTVLTFGGPMIAYLLSTGYSSFYIGLVRTLSVIFELSATWIAPRVMRTILPIRAGMWFLSWQMLCLGGTVAFFFAVKTPIIAASGLVVGTILSRIGLWGYDLSAQIMIQSVGATFTTSTTHLSDNPHRRSVTRLVALSQRQRLPFRMASSYFRTC